MGLVMQKGFLPIPIIIIIGSLILGASAFFVSKKFDLPKEPTIEEREFSSEFGEVLDKDNRSLEYSSPSPESSPNPDTIIYQTPTPKVYKPDESTSISSPIRLYSVAQVSGSLEKIRLNGDTFGGVPGDVNFTVVDSGVTHKSPIQDWTNSEIVVSIPYAINCGQKTDVYVTNSNGQASNKISFTYVICIAITSITPANVKPYGGQITIRGLGFGHTQGYVSFSSTSSLQTIGGCIIESWSNTEIACKDISVPSGNSDYQIRVRNSDGNYSKPVSYFVG